MLRCSKSIQLRSGSSLLHALDRVAYASSQCASRAKSSSRRLHTRSHKGDVQVHASRDARYKLNVQQIRRASQSAPTRQSAVAAAEAPVDDLVSTSPSSSLALADRVLRTANLFGASSSQGQMLNQVHGRLEGDLAGVKPRKRVAIIGSKRSGTASLVTALLDDPMTFSQDVSAEALKVLSSRHLGDGAAVTLRGSRIRYGATPSIRFPLPSEITSALGSLPTVELPLPWLRDSDVELIELIDLPIAHDADLSFLYEVDALLLVSDSYILSQPELASSIAVAGILARFAAKPGTRLIANEVTTAPLDIESALASLRTHSAGLLDRFAAQVSQSSQDTTVIVPVSTADAVSAVAALRFALTTTDLSANSTSDKHEVKASAALWDSFRTLHRRSNISAVGDLVGASNVTPQTSALFALECALSDVEAALSVEADVIRKVEAQSALLRDSALKGVEDEVVRLKERAVIHDHTPLPSAAPQAGWLTSVKGLFGTAAPVQTPPPEEDAAPPPTFSARAYLTHTLDERLSWYRMLAWWRADNVHAEVERAVQRSWGSEREALAAGGREWLIFESARLAGRSDEQYRQAVQALEDLDGSSRLSGGDIAALGPATIGSELLRNALEAHAPRHTRTAFQPLTLIRPYSVRLAQMLAPGGPLTELAARAHRSVLQAYLLAGTSWGVAGTGAAIHTGLLSSLPGVVEGETLQLLALQPGSAVAVALLGALGAMRRVQSGWSRAKRRWWRAWDKVEQGLETDLERTFDDTLRTRVFAAPVVLADGLDMWATRRKAKVEEVRRELQQLKAGP